jgi:hypothetical protein
MLGAMMLIFSVSVQAQTALPGTYSGNLQRRSFTDNNRFQDSAVDKKWFVSKYIGISTSLVFFNGGSATVLSAPIGLQLNRRLNNNWYAFAGVSVAPAYVNFNNSFLSANTNKSQQYRSPFTSNRFDMYSKAELGVMYVNDEKTFSISGSIGIERSSYPLVPLNQMGAVMPNTFVAPNNRGIQ